MKKILIIGTGFYSLGYDEILGICYSSILQWSKENNDNDILITFLIRNNTKKKVRHILSRKRKNELFFNHKLKVKIAIEENINFKEHSSAFLILPEKYHFYYSKMLIKNKVPIFAVKPFCFSLKENKKMLSLSKKNKTDIYIDYHKRYDLENRFIGDCIKKDKSNSYQIIINYSQNIKMMKIFNKWINTSNPFQYLGPHYLDLLNIWFKPKILKIQSFSSNYVSKKLKLKTSDLVSVNMKLKSGTKTIIANINTNWIENINYPMRSRQNIEVISENLHINSDQGYRGLDFVNKKNIFEIRNNNFTFYNNKTLSGYGYLSFKAFLDKIYFNKDNKSLASIEQNFFCSNVLDIVRKQLNEN